MSVSVTIDAITRNVDVTVSNQRGTPGVDGAGTWNDLTGTAPVIPFEPVPAPSHEEGLLFYDENDKSLTYYNDEADVAMNIGREMWIRIRNDSGAAILNGKVVYINDAQGQFPTIRLARADTAISSRVIGIATHDIGNNEFGYVTTVGEVKGLNTSAFDDGDLLFLSAVTAGEMTITAPLAPNRVVQVATVIHAHPSQGKLYCHPENDSIPSTGIVDSTATGRALVTAVDAVAGRTALGLGSFALLNNDGTATLSLAGATIGSGTFSVNGVTFGRGGGAIATNTAAGFEALAANTTGLDNAVFGYRSMLVNTTGNGNAGLGSGCLFKNTTGNSNTAIGNFTLFDNVTGSENTALGSRALLSNTGSLNTAVGRQSLTSNTTGSSNAAVGINSGRFIADGTTANTVTNNSVYLGAETKALASGQTNQIVIGHQAIGAGSNSTTIGNDSITLTVLKGNTVVPRTSDLANFERVGMRWDSTTAKVGTSSGGSSPGRDLVLEANSIERQRILAINGNHGIGTQAPASRLTVAGGDIEVVDSASGIILKSPDGTRWRVTISNAGGISAASITPP